MKPWSLVLLLRTSQSQIHLQYYESDRYFTENVTYCLRPNMTLLVQARKKYVVLSTNCNTLVWSLYEKVTKCTMPHEHKRSSMKSSVFPK